MAYSYKNFLPGGLVASYERHKESEINKVINECIEAVKDLTIPKLEQKIYKAVRNKQRRTLLFSYFTGRQASSDEDETNRYIIDYLTDKFRAIAKQKGFKVTSMIDAFSDRSIKFYLVWPMVQIALPEDE